MSCSGVRDWMDKEMVGQQFSVAKARLSRTHFMEWKSFLRNSKGRVDKGNPWCTKFGNTWLNKMEPASLLKDFSELLKC